MNLRTWRGYLFPTLRVVAQLCIARARCGWGRAKSYISGLEPSFRLANIGKVIGGELLALQRLANLGTCLGGMLLALHALLRLLLTWHMSRRSACCLNSLYHLCEQSIPPVLDSDITNTKLNVVAETGIFDDEITPLHVVREFRQRGQLSILTFFWGPSTEKTQRPSTAVLSCSIIVSWLKFRMR